MSFDPKFKKMAVYQFFYRLSYFYACWNSDFKGFFQCPVFWQAEKLIRNQIALKETPTLWCYLGDVTHNPEDYLRAWELSKGHSSRAQRSLGYLCIRNHEVWVFSWHVTSTWSLVSDFTRSEALFIKHRSAATCFVTILVHWKVIMFSFVAIPSTPPQHGIISSGFGFWGSIKFCHIYMQLIAEYYTRGIVCGRMRVG